MELNDLIKYENESTYLDFKKIQYQKENYVDFIKDIMSMANADIKESTRYIVIGVEHKSTGRKKIIGIKEDEFIDPATYQQIIRENIDGELSLEYHPFSFENKILGIFKISNCNDKPYMMKKDYSVLKKGNGFIRKGTHQCGLLRSDLDTIFKDKISKNIFSGEIDIFFSNNGKKEIELPALSKDFILPSENEAKNIKNSIKFIIESESYPEKGVDLGLILNKDIDHIKARQIIESHFKSRKQNLSDFPKIEKLLNSLEKIKDIYKLTDEYVLFKENSHKINLNIINKSSQYIKDAAIELRFKKEFLAVRIKETEEPKNYYSLGIEISNLIPVHHNYPDIKCENGYVKIFYKIGDLKHHIINTDILDIPIRIVFGQKLLKKTVKIHCKIYGENLPKPFEELLTIKVI